jgi:hypothetical protein
VRRTGETGRAFRRFLHLRRRESPCGDRLSLGQREVHDPAAVAVHPERGNEMPACIDHCDGMSLLFRRSMRGAAGDDRLRRAGVEGDLLCVERRCCGNQDGQTD